LVPEMNDTYIVKIKFEFVCYRISRG
jgi:hypothetical protein